MIFFSNAEGTINAVVSSPVYQGSNYANEVVFVAPFVPVSVVTVSFIKPNGEYTPAALMTVKELTGIKDEKGNAFNAWTYLVPEAYTEYSGVLTAQFKVTNGNTVLATASSSFNVQKGVPNVTTEPPEDIYQQILSALSEIKQDIANLEDGTTEVGKAKEAEKAEQAEYYTTASGDQSVNTIEAQFSNKLDKQTGVPSYPQVYAVEGNTQKLIPVSNGSTIAPNDRIAQYTSSGTLFTQPPETDSDTTNKGYVDGEIKKSNDEQMVINERIVEILDGIEIVKVSDLEYNLMVDETIKGTINIPKDQFLKSVSYDPETHVLTFIFLTSDGEVPTPIDMSSLVDVYQAGNGLTLANNTFSVKLDPSSNNALTLSAAGLMLDKTPLENALEILNSDIPKSAEETGAFISGDNTLAGAKAEVEVQSKNLFDINKLKPPTTIDSLGGLSDIIQVTNGEMINPRPLYSNSAYINIPINLIKGTYTISGECWIDLNDPQGNVVYIGMWDGKKVGGSINTTITPGQWTKVQYTYIVEDLHAFTLQFQQGGNTASDTCTLKVRNIQLERGETATAFMPYLPAGTAVEVQACGKNLFDLNADKYWGSADITERAGSTFTVSGQAGTWIAVEFILPEIQNKTLTVSGEWITSGSNVGGLRVQWITQNGIAVGDTIAETYISGQAATGTVPKKPDNAKYLGFFVYSNTNGTVTGSTSVTYENVQLEIGETATYYASYEGLTYPAAVGETIEVEQYDGVTNIISITAGAAVSTQFLQSTRYELDTKPVSLAGTYAERPTGTYPYVVLYTATDTGRTYRLERDTDGSVSSNWVNISSAGGTGGGFTPRGEWNSATTYNEKDLVSLNGSSYICIEENTNATPASNPDKWMVNAEKGETGATGATGTTGPAGTNGKDALIYGDIKANSTEPIVGLTVQLTTSKFNRTPVVMEYCTVTCTYNGRIFTVLGRIAATNDTTTELAPINVVNYTGSTGPQGPQGPAGANGANGKDYLIYKGDTLTGTSNPNNYSGVIPVDDFNRIPATDEYFIALYKQTLTSGSQLSYCLLQVAMASDSGALCQVVKSELLNTQKYLHRVHIQNGGIRAIFEFENTSPTSYGSTSALFLNNAIYNYGAQAEVSAIQATGKGATSDAPVIGIFVQQSGQSQAMLYLADGVIEEIDITTFNITDVVVTK